MRGIRSGWIFLLLLVFAAPFPLYAYSLINPVSYINSSTPYAVGVVSYGLYNISNGSGPYQVQTGEIIGYAKISRLAAFNSSPPGNTSAYGATLQLNAVLNITSAQGNNYSYWIQDVMDMNTSNGTYMIGDNVWNMTGLFANTSSGTIIGRGNSTFFLTPLYNGTQINESFYSYFPNYTYPSAYPLYFIPAERVKIVNSYPVVQVGYEQNGSYYWYDNVTFDIPAKSAYFLVTPYYQTPAPELLHNASSFYDAELVLGGEGSGEVSNFSQANVTLWIGYLDNQTLIPFPAVGVFGSDTQEAARNLAISQANGDALITTGSLYYNRTLLLYGTPLLLLTNSTNATHQVTSQTTTTPIVSTGNNQSTGSDTLFAEILVSLVVIVVLYIAFRSLRKESDS